MGKSLYLIGTDEAGYGPNLGPLVVSGTLWRLDDAMEFTCDDALLESLNMRLEPICSKKGIFPIIDSKQLYHAGHIALLERSFLTALGLLSIRCHHFQDLLEKIAPSSAPLPFWEESFSIPFPRAEFLPDPEPVRAALADAGLTLVSICSRRIQPEEFNDEIAQGKLKSDLLAEQTFLRVQTLLSLVQRLTGEEEPEVLILCDKLGGRNRYLPLLQTFFPDNLIQVVLESSKLSAYITGNYRIRFQVKGEANRPTALASIVSKYLRERSMDQFNVYWQQRKPSLAPTAGYPEDAKRFLQDLRGVASEEEIEKIWRMK